MPLATNKTGSDLSTLDKFTMIVVDGLSLPDRVRQVEAAHDDAGHQTIHASVCTHSCQYKAEIQGSKGPDSQICNKVSARGDARPPTGSKEQY